MKKVILPALLFFLFVMESVYVDIVPNGHLHNEQIFAPHFLLVLILFISIYQGYLSAMIFAVLFGLLFDTVYTGIIGIFAFSMPLTAYIIAKLSGILQSNIFVSAFLSLVGIVILEFFMYGINLLIGFTTMPIQPFLNNRLLPTLILNAAFVLIVSYPTKKLLERLAIEE